MLDLLCVDRFASSVFFFYLMQLFIDDEPLYVPLFVACYFFGAIITVVLWEAQIIRGSVRKWVIVSILVTFVSLVPPVLLQSKDRASWSFVMLLAGMARLHIPSSIMTCGNNNFISPQTVTLLADSFSFAVILFMTTYPSIAHYLLLGVILCWTFIAAMSLKKNDDVRLKAIPYAKLPPAYASEHLSMLYSIKGLVEFNSFAQYSIFTFSVVFIFMRSGVALALYAYWLGILAIYGLWKLRVDLDKVNKLMAWSSILLIVCATCSFLFFALQLPDVSHEVVHSIAIVVTASLVKLPSSMLDSLGKDEFPLIGLYLKTQYVSGPVGIIVTWAAFKLQAIGPYIILSLLLVYVTGDYERAYLQFESRN